MAQVAKKSRNKGYCLVFVYISSQRVWVILETFNILKNLIYVIKIYMKQLKYKWKW
jgi:hypothetical protein